MSILKKNKGFSLLELMMVLAVASSISFMKFQDLKREQEATLADAVGQQIKQVGDAVNGYISIHYDKLSTLTNSKSESTDPGPRTCSTSTNTCTITYQTLVNDGLLSSSFTGKNVKNQTYNIVLKRSGISPNYIINGLVTTDSAWTEGSSVRYDLLGKAMQAAGVDSGMSKTTSVLSGYSGSWTANSSDFTAVNKTGLLGYRVGYDSSMYSIYLRRDGTLPMTGDLNMGSNSINNAQDITASGTTTSGTLKSTGDTNVGGNLTVAQTGAFTGNIGAKGMSPNNQPSGYLGGVISPDYYAQAGIYIAKNGTNIPDKNWAFQANRDGYLAISGNMNAGGNITAGNWLIAHNGGGNTMYIGGDGAPAADGSVGNDYEIRMDTGKSLTVWNTATNSDRTKTVLDVWGTQRVAGNLNVISYGGANGEITASGNITSQQTITGQYLKSSQVVSAGTTCSDNGLLARDSTGQVLSCVSGIWQPEQPVGSPIAWPSTTPPSGWLICNGQAFNKSQYPLLAKAYPSGVLPDLRGSFIRGLDQGRGIDSGRTVLTEQRASVVTGTDDNWSDNDVGVLHGPSSLYSRDSINVYDYTTGSNGQDPKYWVHFGGGTGPALGKYQDVGGDIRLNNNGSNGFYGGARPYNTAFVYIVRAM